MNNWLKTERLASSKSVQSRLPAESTENISEEAVAGCSSTEANTEDPGAGQDRQNTPTNKKAESKERTVSKKRKYDESYLSFGLFSVGIAKNLDGPCVICSKIMFNNSLVPANLKRHLDTNHHEHIVSCVLGEDAAKKVAAVQCSNNILSDRIHKISDHIEDKLTCRLKDSEMFSLQLDSSDVAGLSILLVFVRYPFKGSIEEDLFLCTPLETNTTGEEIFKAIDNYMTKHHIDWNKCIDVCSNGAAAIVGKIKETVTRIKNIAPNCSSSYCVLHRHALVPKNMPSASKKVLD
ncbi:zinc finger BED domain-containing protein 5-like [Diabrotica undecimpunctata]|uniref:zinc finger BED domain-containing protein 5-like n=1 Tax=Diabrotica undecimpunctata TaxID=50387 RepID=UPI003B63FEEA